MDPSFDQLIRLLTGWKRHKIVVTGDFMLDRYVYGNAERLSPDAPVPVLAAQRTENRPGGASNVCLDLLALKCDVACLGVTGADAAGQQLRGALAEAGCDVSGLVEVGDRPTTVKQNFIGLAQHRHPQKMFRVDDESREVVPKAVADGLMAKARRLLRGAKVLCLEDYNKGVLGEGLCQQLIKLSKRMRVPVLIDPAAITDYRKYRGATCITPNRTEAALATTPAKPGRKKNPQLQLDAMAGQLLESLGLGAVVLTLDKQGALLAVKGRPTMRVPTQARAVYDVTGAGDMVLAMLAAARAAGADWYQAVQLANTAAGLEVERFGVVPIELEEVLLALLERHHQDRGKVRTVDQLLPELAAHRKRGKKIAFTNGCFDILHAGHVALLRGARATADLLVLAVNTDRSIRRLKGPQRPIVPQQDRIEVLQELQCVDYIVLFGSGTGGDNDTPKPLLKAIQPDVLVKGGTYKLSQVVGADIVKSYGGKVKTIPPIVGRSTTNIVERIKADAKRERD